MAAIVITWGHVAVIALFFLIVQGASLFSMQQLLKRFAKVEISVQVKRAMDQAARESDWTAQIKALNQKISVMYDVMAAVNELSLVVAEVNRTLRSVNNLPEAP